MSTPEGTNAWDSLIDEHDAAVALVHRLAEALRLTQEYVGSELLPPMPGWSWFDALREYDASKIRASRDSGGAT